MQVPQPRSRPFVRFSRLDLVSSGQVLTVACRCVVTVKGPAFFNAGGILRLPFFSRQTRSLGVFISVF